MNNPAVFLLYLAGPIDGVTEREAHGWRDELMRVAPSGVVCFDPSLAWAGVNRLTAPAVDAGNRLIIRSCSGVIANMAGEGRAFGTIREIEFARHHGIPVAIATGSREPIESLLSYDLLQAEQPIGALEALMEYIVEGVQQQQRHPLYRLFGLGEE